jgi:hypothetical protein
MEFEISLRVPAHRILKIYLRVPAHRIPLDISEKKASQKQRESFVKNEFPRLAYSYSDIVIYVGRDSFATNIYLNSITN